jgi:GH15 family glucan-1,4-alpha-glucosidase
MAYEIRDLGVISNRRTGAVIDRSGDICWYCPEQFDNPSLFASLLDDEKGGCWSLELPDHYQVKRRYPGNSSILESSYESDNDSFNLTDWMPLHDDFSGLCRLFSKSSGGITNKIIPAPGYGGDEVHIHRISDFEVVVNDEHFFLFSHPCRVDHRQILFQIPSGDRGWSVLSDKPVPGITIEKLEESLDKTRIEWDKIGMHISYEGPYKEEVFNSIRAIRMLTHEHSGGIIAALTSSLPEVPGKDRNYDYRYVWLRDASMIVSALTRAGSEGRDERKFLDFICSARNNIQDYSTTPFVTVKKQAAPAERYLELKGYKNSQPVRVGNNANQQLQLDAGSNILLAAKLIYNHYGIRDHWETIAGIADFLAENWLKEDHGIWEEHIARHFTSSKVILTVALEYISEHSRSERQKKRWRETAGQIRDFIAANCLTSSGSYAVFAGSDEVDITAVLFPEWAYCKADTPEMISTVRELEARFCEKDLVYRNLLLFDEKKEGAFLAASFWMAQYWIMRNNYEKSKAYIDAALKYKNDLGLFAEEADPHSDQMRGNFPQSFVHASFIGAAIDFNNAFNDKK